jgi:hypothetical protein
MNFISKVSSGKASLFSSYWFICFPIGLVINLVDKTGGQGEQLFLVLLIPFLWSLYGVWKCAFNVRYVLWGYITRGVLIANVLVFLLGFFSGFATEIRKPDAVKSTMPAHRLNGADVMQSL